MLNKFFLLVSIYCGKYSKYSTCELVLPMHSFQNWFSLWWLNMIFKWKNQSWSPIVFFYFDIFNKMLFLGVKDMKSQVDILSFFIEHLSFCFHSYFFHFTDLHKTYVHIMYIRSWCVGRSRSRGSNVLDYVKNTLLSMLRWC